MKVKTHIKTLEDAIKTTALGRGDELVIRVGNDVYEFETTSIVFKFTSKQVHLVAGKKIGTFKE